MSRIKSADVLYLPGKEDSTAIGRGYYSLHFSTGVSIALMRCLETLQTALLALFKDMYMQLAKD